MAVKVVSPEQSELATLVMCMPDTGVRYFSDDVESSCSKCGCAIIHRPTVPTKPPKVCVNCVKEMIEAEKAG